MRCGLELGERGLEFPAKERKLIISGLPELRLTSLSVSVFWNKAGKVSGGAECVRVLSSLLPSCLKAFSSNKLISMLQ